MTLCLQREGDERPSVRCSFEERSLSVTYFVLANDLLAFLYVRVELDSLLKLRISFSLSFFFEAFDESVILRASGGRVEWISCREKLF